MALNCSSPPLFGKFRRRMLIHDRSVAIFIGRIPIIDITSRMSDNTIIINFNLQSGWSLQLKMDENEKNK